MKRWPIYILIALLGAISCSKSDSSLPATQNETIELEVVAMPTASTRSNMLNSSDDIIAQGEFALSAYLSPLDAPYFTDAWVYYFVPDDGVARWRFRDVVNQDYLIDFYWPDGEVDFMAYMPRILTKCAATISDVAFDPATNMTSFNAVAQSEINDRTEAEREAEHAKQEFVFATNFDQSKNGGSVKLRFVHPFAAVKFRLHQSHRDLVIHSITLHGLDKEGSFSSVADTFEEYLSGNNGQNYITCSNWTTSNTGDLIINLEKRVPDDVNYQSQIGGPYMVIPQVLKSSDSKDIKISVTYSWNGNRVQSAQFSLSTSHVTEWMPGNIYTYTLDLGDNKEEILFKVTVEEWVKGEDEGYENNFDVQ